MTQIRSHLSPSIDSGPISPVSNTRKSRDHQRELVIPLSGRLSHSAGNVCVPWPLPGRAQGPRRRPPPQRSARESMPLSHCAARVARTQSVTPADAQFGPRRGGGRDTQLTDKSLCDLNHEI
jgi:hypothetical protein